jgi:hypothetical protein
MYQQIVDFVFAESRLPNPVSHDPFVIALELNVVGL